jgi:hypothetical protein
MENNPINQQVTTPAIRRYEISKNLFPGIEDFYLRTKYGDAYSVDSFEELWKQFCSEDGYRISFPVGDGTYEMVLYKQASEKDIAEADRVSEDMKKMLDEGKFGEVLNKEVLDDRTIWYFVDGGSMEILA